jgi:hypothetical protein
LANESIVQPPAARSAAVPAQAAATRRRGNRIEEAAPKAASVKRGHKTATRSRVDFAELKAVNFI